jgi:hypothetical protein
VSTCNSLPYIQIQHPPLKLLVDTGCFVSIIRPSVAETNFPSSIYYGNSKIKTATGEKEIKFKADIPAFSEFCSNDIFRFLLYDFHDFFDGIIGLRDLLKLKLSIDLTNNRLISDSLIIPLYFRQPDEKSFTNADALSRIEINAVEDDNSSIIVNIGDTMTEISQVTDEYLNNSDHVPQSAAPKSVEPTPSTSKIKIISNVQIKPPDRVISDNETIHSAVENPIVEIPVTDKPLNNYKNQIIINCPRDAINHNVKTQKIFDKTRLIFSIPLNNFETNMIKQYLNPKQSYTLFFKTPEIAPRFTKIVQMYFKNTSFKFVKSNVLLTDVIDLDEQKDTKILSRG